MSDLHIHKTKVIYGYSIRAIYMKWNENEMKMICGVVAYKITSDIKEWQEEKKVF